MCHFLHTRLQSKFYPDDKRMHKMVEDWVWGIQQIWVSIRILTLLMMTLGMSLHVSELHP